LWLKTVSQQARQPQGQRSQGNHVSQTAKPAKRLPDWVEHGEGHTETFISLPD
jgi:hypothetical protein